MVSHRHFAAGTSDVTLALTFPGQGSQHVGMGKALAEAFGAAREVFAEVDEALAQNLSQLMWLGPEDELTLTENAQPALMAVSLAALRAAGSEAGLTVADALFVAGHSLGELSALAAAGSIPLADTARLLRIRGRAMQAAVPAGQGAMAALIGIEIDAARQVAADASAATGGAECVAANDNAPGQVVISGAAAAVEKAAGLARDAGARRAIMLQVSAPFHCALMRPAAEAMRAALKDQDIRAPRVPLVANVTAAAVGDPGEIRRLLVEQVTGLVRWRESVLHMADGGATTFVELGAGKVLTGLAKRIRGGLAAHAVGEPADIAALAALRP
jgi:[acyl-carrier-protein] S-malonyltransferase